VGWNPGLVPDSPHSSQARSEGRLKRLMRAEPASAIVDHAQSSLRATTCKLGLRGTQRIGIVDDVLTAGTHYCAMKSTLQARFPGVLVVGFFIARRVQPDRRLATSKRLLHNNKI
jgi:hypothetical protein